MSGRGDLGPFSVLLVINGTDFGGTESALAQIALTLRRRGHRINVLSLKRIGRTGRELAGHGIPVSSLDLDEVVTPYGFASAIFRMAGWMRGRHFDVVQSFLPRANIVSRAANQLVRPPRPHLSSERSTDFRRSLLVAKLTGLTSRWTDRVLAISPAIREVLVRRDRVPRERIAILENGIDGIPAGGLGSACQCGNGVVLQHHPNRPLPHLRYEPR